MGADPAEVGRISRPQTSLVQDRRASRGTTRRPGRWCVIRLRSPSTSLPSSHSSPRNVSRYPSRTQLTHNRRAASGHRQEHGALRPGTVHAQPRPGVAVLDAVAEVVVGAVHGVEADQRVGADVLAVVLDVAVLPVVRVVRLHDVRVVQVAAGGVVVGRGWTGGQREGLLDAGARGVAELAVAGDVEAGAARHRAHADLALAARALRSRRLPAGPFARPATRAEASGRTTVATTVHVLVMPSPCAATGLPRHPQQRVHAQNLYRHRSRVGPHQHPAVRCVARSRVRRRERSPHEPGRKESGSGFPPAARRRTPGRARPRPSPRPPGPPSRLSICAAIAAASASPSRDARPRRRCPAPSPTAAFAVSSSPSSTDAGVERASAASPPAPRAPRRRPATPAPRRAPAPTPPAVGQPHGPIGADGASIDRRCCWAASATPAARRRAPRARRRPPRTRQQENPRQVFHCNVTLSSM